jgi:hypothetical protein
MAVHREDGAMALGMLAILAIFSTSIPHMYNRLWIVPLMLALAASFGRAAQQGFAPADDDDDYHNIFEIDGTPTAAAMKERRA